MNVLAIIRSARLVSWVYRFLSTLVGLVTVRLINDAIGLAGYGDTAFILAFMTGLAAIDLGLLQALPRFVARVHGGDASERGALWRTMLLLLGGLQLMQALLVVALSLVLGVVDQLRGLGAAELIVLGVTYSAGNLLAASSAVYAGWQRYGMSGAGKIGRSILYLLAIVGLGMADDLSIRAVLWASALSALVPNLLVTGALVLRHGSAFMDAMRNATSGAQETAREILSYSLRGWMFTASTVLVSAGAVFVAGLLLAPAAVAKLQIGLVLYSGAAAFVTGSMVPLTTIRVRLAGGGAEAQRKIETAARSIAEESVALVAMLGAFFIVHIDLVLRLLLGPQNATPDVLALTRAVVLSVLLPGLLVLPWFTFRFALVSHEDNARYCRRLFTVTCLLLLGGAVGAVVWAHPFSITAAVAFALTYRGTLAFSMGRSVVPGIRFATIAGPLLRATTVFALIGLGLRWVDTGWTFGPIDDNWLRASIFVLTCVPCYLYRRRLSVLWGLRLKTGGLDHDS